MYFHISERQELASEEVKLFCHNFETESLEIRNIKSQYHNNMLVELIQIGFSLVLDYMTRVLGRDYEFNITAI